MPAKNSKRVSEEGTYSHIYNKGIENRIIFNERDDYEVFLGYLRDYLSTPGETAKKEFTVNGRIFRGVPHQPKNHFNQVELLAYSLMPNHFHLVLHQKTRGSIERFMRSLTTRYSMYFNKKYNRSGTLFVGPYKAVHVKDMPSLFLLSRYLHKGDGSGYSSYPEYLGQKETSWVKPEVVLALAGNDKEKYKKFVEEHAFTEKENEALEGIVLESISKPLERRDPHLVRSKTFSEFSQNQSRNLNQHPKSQPRFAEIFAVIAVFLALVGLGVRNIKASSKTAESSLSPTVAGTKDEKPLGPDSDHLIIVEENKSITVAVVKITDGASSVNVRKEPSIQSEKIGEVKEGDTFDKFTSLSSGWYEVKLTDGGTGYIWAKYILERSQP